MIAARDKKKGTHYMDPCYDQMKEAYIFWTAGHRIGKSRTAFHWKTLRANRTEPDIVPMKYTNWAPERPDYLKYGDYDCVMVASDVRFKYQWSNENCYLRMCALCEF